MTDHNGSTTPHYLEHELYELVRSDSSIFDFLQSGSLDGIWYWDLVNPEHEWMSPRFWETMGYDPAEMPHQSNAWQDIINQDDLKIAIDNLNKHLEDPGHPFDQSVRYRHRNGQTVWVRCRGMAIRDADGKAIRMLGAHTDITPIKEAEQELRRINGELAEKNAELAQFAYAASHDLRAPIRNLQVMVNLLFDEHFEQLDKDAQTAMTLTHKAVNRVAELTKRILDFATISDNQGKIESVDLNKLLTEICEDLRQDILAAEAVVNFKDLPTIIGQPTALRHLFQNLVSNAVKFQKRGPDRPATSVPTVDVSCEQSDSEWLFCVSDNGIGIPEKYFKHVFEGFTRLHSQREFSGVGIGLTLCRKAVRLHRGRIWIESKENEGTKVYFTLHKD